MKNLEKTVKNKMVEFDHFEICPKDRSIIFMKTRLRKLLAEIGLEKIFSQKKFIGGGVEVSYNTNHYEGPYNLWLPVLEIKIKTIGKDQKNAMEVYQAIAKDFDIVKSPIISECEKVKIENPVFYMPSRISKYIN